MKTIEKITNAAKVIGTAHQPKIAAVKTAVMATKICGKNPATGLVEIIELPNHPFFIGVQYHPELKSTVENPHPIFVHFVKAAKEFAEKTLPIALFSNNDFS